MRNFRIDRIDEFWVFGFKIANALDLSMEDILAPCFIKRFNIIENEVRNVT